MVTETTGPALSATGFIALFTGVAGECDGDAECNGNMLQVADDDWEYLGQHQTDAEQQRQQWLCFVIQTHQKIQYKAACIWC